MVKSPQTYFIESDKRKVREYSVLDALIQSKHLHNCYITLQLSELTKWQNFIEAYLSKCVFESAELGQVLLLSSFATYRQSANHKKMQQLCFNALYILLTNPFECKNQFQTHRHQSDNTDLRSFEFRPLRKNSWCCTDR